MTATERLWLLTYEISGKRAAEVVAAPDEMHAAWSLALEFVDDAYPVLVSVEPAPAGVTREGIWRDGELV
jgi:hypothetical protein